MTLTLNTCANMKCLPTGCCNY